MTSLSDIKGWFDAAKKNGSAYMIVVCDTFDHEDYPLGVYTPIKDAADCMVQYGAHDGPNMQRVMEVYDLSKPWSSAPGLRHELPTPAQLATATTQMPRPSRKPVAKRKPAKKRKAKK